MADTTIHDNEIVIPQIGVTDDNRLDQLPVTTEKVIYTPESGNQYIDIDGKRVKISDIVSDGFINGANITNGSGAIDHNKLINGKVYKYKDSDEMLVMYIDSQESSPFIQNNLIPLKERNSITFGSDFKSYVVFAEISEEDNILFSVNGKLFYYGASFESLTENETSQPENIQVFTIKNPDNNKVLLALDLEQIIGNPITVSINSHTKVIKKKRLFDSGIFVFITNKDELTSNGYTEYKYPTYRKKVK